MLLNLKEDPHEQNDVKTEYPQICDNGARIILDWQEKALLETLRSRTLSGRC